MIIDQFIATIRPQLKDEDLICFRRMANYLGRSNLWPTRHEFREDSGHLFSFANEAERFVFSLTDLHRHLEDMRSGKAFDWNACVNLR